MKKGLTNLILIALGILFTITGCDSSQEYNYITPQDVAMIIKDDNKDYTIIDIQPQESFEAHHLKGAIPTYAYPADAPEMQEKLKEGISSLQSEQKIIVVCPRGKGGAKNSVDYYRTLGISNDRLLILEKGQEGWPQDLVDVLETNENS